MIAKIANDTGLKVFSMRGGPLFWTTFSSDNPEIRKNCIDLARKAMECLQIMGGKTLLVVPGKWEENSLYSEVYNYAKETAERIGEEARKYGITVGLENVENKFLFSPLEWCRFIDSLNNPYIKMYLDIGNIVYLGLGYPEQWVKELGKERIASIHFKDATELKSTTYLFQGNIDWVKVMKAIRDIDYEGWISAELPLYKYHQQLSIKQTGESLKVIVNSI